MFSPFSIAQFSFQFPSGITTTSLRPDIVVWSTKAKAVLLTELTVPWEEGIEGGWLEDHHLSNGSWMLRLLGVVNQMPTEGHRSDGRKAEEGNKRTGRRGREGQVLGK
ncbi:hypothetical protein N1851_007673 [Merluccius polli]|uniref:Uncharacterized protein n=1 Tax=Merluccius polli TaxID=89951 RepID=A0AA47N2H5_MERPO|nr:hypothetical protein N1851_007673 [Merluccius polli]